MVHFECPTTRTLLQTRSGTRSSTRTISHCLCSQKPLLSICWKLGKRWLIDSLSWLCPYQQRTEVPAIWFLRPCWCDELQWFFIIESRGSSIVIANNLTCFVVTGSECTLKFHKFQLFLHPVRRGLHRCEIIFYQMLWSRPFAFFFLSFLFFLSLNTPTAQKRWSSYGRLVNSKGYLAELKIPLPTNELPKRLLSCKDAEADLDIPTAHLPPITDQKPTRETETAWKKDWRNNCRLPSLTELGEVPRAVIVVGKSNKGWEKFTHNGGSSHTRPIVARTAL